MQGKTRIFTALVISAMVATAAIAAPRRHRVETAPKPYAVVAVTRPDALADAAFVAFRGQLAEAAQKKDKAMLATLVTAEGFFWERENGDSADKGKSGADGLAAALALEGNGARGWGVLAGYANDPVAARYPGRPDVWCAPPEPKFQDVELQAALRTTQSDIVNWAYARAPNIPVRAGIASSTAIMDMLGMHFVRIVPDTSPAAAVAFVTRIETPAGKTGYVPTDAVVPLASDQLCYRREGERWTIAGYIGAGEQP